ncbi:MAG: hypothetical protein M2R45_02283 [Verrucomicrobia subdivision 3 bacterium]|nr:hypothetical protein [Limisphaerales bacterium]MCS1414662.1 hypothetical protein [Limisphaerales bacterium]
MIACHALEEIALPEIAVPDSPCAEPRFEKSFNCKYLMKNKLSLIALVLAVGCASPGGRNPSGVPVTEMRADERGFVTGTGIESQDLVTVTDQMARSILATPEIRQFGRVPRVTLDPVINETRFPINKDIFLTRIRTELNRKARGHVRFLARERLATLQMEHEQKRAVGVGRPRVVWRRSAALQAEREQKRAGTFTSSSDPNLQEFKGADFLLTGKLQGLTTRTAAGVSDYVLYSFQLIDARTTEILWEDAAEIKKQGLEDAAYR